MDKFCYFAFALTLAYIFDTCGTALTKSMDKGYNSEVKVRDCGSLSFTHNEVKAENHNAESPAPVPENPSEQTAD